MFKEIMKQGYIHVLLVMLVLGGGFLSTGCEDEMTPEEKKAREQRYFDLYMASNFGDYDVEETESGLRYIEIAPGNMDSVPAREDWIKLNYVGYLIPGEEVVDTYLKHVAIDHGIYSNGAMYGPFKMMNGFKAEGLTEGLTKMGARGKAILCFTSDLGFGEQGVQLMQTVPSYASMKYEVELLEVIGEDIETYEHNNLLRYKDSIPGVLSVTDSATEVVLYYVKDKKTIGNPVAADSVVQIAYKGYLFDGRVFDQSEEGSPYEFTVDDTNADESPIAGWHLGVKQFLEGEEGRLIIPYELAYGEYGRLSNNYVAIPPYENLVFEIKVVSVESGESDTDSDENL